MKQTWLVVIVGVFAALIVGLVAHEARATDGVKLLKQPKTFPIVISAAGSYRLKSNLSVPDENTTAISVQADYVTIDLNGFSIQGPVTCTGSPVTGCSPSSGTGVGINGGGHRGIAVRNGSVHGMGFRGIDFVDRVENVTADGNGDIGISAAVVTGSGANGNYEIGIAGGTVSNCSTSGNRLLGIEGDGAVSNSTASGNGEGIYSAGGSVSNCSASGNTGFGIAASNSSVTNCTVESNAAGGIVAKTATGCTALSNGGSQISATGVVGHNICNSSPCP